VSEGTVYNYLPINIGDDMTPQRLREALKALYGTDIKKKKKLCQFQLLTKMQM